MNNKITSWSAEPAIRFAAEEWARLAMQYGGRLRAVASDAAVTITTIDEALEHGCSARLQAELADQRELKQGSYWMEVKGREVLLAGLTPAAALYAVYDFFKVYAGVHWIYPGEEPALSDELPALPGPEGEARLYEPWFGRRGFVFENIYDPVFISDMIDWMAKNRVGEIFFTFMLWDNIRDTVAPEIVKRGMDITLGGHSMKFFLDKEEALRRQSADHPYTAKRQLDYGDPSWQQSVIGMIADYCADVPRLTRVSLWPEDVSSQSETFLELYIRHTEQLKRKLYDKLPGVEVEHISYNAGLSWKMLDRGSMSGSREIDTLLAFWGRDYRYGLEESPSLSDRKADRIERDWAAEAHRNGRKLTIFEYYSDHYMFSALFPSIPSRIVADMAYFRELRADGLTNLVVPCPGYPDYDWKWAQAFNGYVFCRALWGDDLSGILNDYYTYYSLEQREPVKALLELVENAAAEVTGWNIPLFPHRIVDADKIPEQEKAQARDKVTALLEKLSAGLDQIQSQAAPGTRAGKAFDYAKHLAKLADLKKNEWS
ncbi:hypothetical protein PV433_30160 [Paenibacillus sp. GYB004]|uniref:hypothetical protein n=1 Tax=Paenibacillus sp. GYB004 TaxID=2994393 RepID=UPI002F9631C0